MLQVIHTDVAKVDWNVAYVAMVVHVCCKLLFHCCGRATQFNIIPSVLVRHLTLSTQEIKLNPVVYRVHPTGELKNPRFHQDHKQVNKAYIIY